MPEARKKDSVTSRIGFCSVPRWEQEQDPWLSFLLEVHRHTAGNLLSVCVVGGPVN